MRVANCRAGKKDVVKNHDGECSNNAYFILIILNFILIIAIEMLFKEEEELMIVRLSVLCSLNQFAAAMERLTTTNVNF